jgi:hypothetical protein
VHVSRPLCLNTKIDKMAEKYFYALKGIRTRDSVRALRSATRSAELISTENDSISLPATVMEGLQN